jgi:hypothetical protein
MKQGGTGDEIPGWAKCTFKKCCNFKLIFGSFWEAPQGPIANKLA